MTVDFKLEGFSEFEAVLKELPLVTARATARRIMKRSLQPVADDANGSAPVRKGGLSSSYVVGTKLNKSQRRRHRKEADVEMFVGTNDPAGVQTEFGNAHQSAQPHFRPAWRRNMRGVLTFIGNEYWDEIHRTYERARRAGKV